MMNKTSLSFRAAVLAFGNGTAAVAQMLIAAVLARYLTQADFGIYKQTFLLYNTVLPVICLGLPAALLYFLPRQEERARNVLCENLLILAVGGAVLSAFLLLGGAELVAHLFSEPKLVTPLRWFAIHPLFSLPLAAVAPCLIAAQRAEWVAGFAIARGMIRFVLVVVPVVLFLQTPVMAIQGAAATSVVLFIPGLLLMFRAHRQGSFHPSWAGIREQLGYAVPLGIGSMIGTIHKSTDKFVVATMVPSDAYAVFECGAMEIPFISLVTGSASAVIVPEIARLYGEGQFTEALAIFRRSAVKCGSILIPLAGWFFLAAPWIMTYLYGAGFVKSATIFRIYLLLLPLRVAFFGSLFQAGRPERSGHDAFPGGLPGEHCLDHRWSLSFRYGRRRSGDRSFHPAVCLRVLLYGGVTSVLHTNLGPVTLEGTRKTAFPGTDSGRWLELSVGCDEMGAGPQLNGADNTECFVWSGDHPGLPRNELTPVPNGTIVEILTATQMLLTTYVLAVWEWGPV